MIHWRFFMKIFFVVTCSTVLLSQQVSAQSIEMIPGTFREQAAGALGLASNKSAVELCSTSPNATKTCVNLRLDNPQNAIGFHSLKRLESIQGATSQTSGRVQDLATSISDLNAKVNALTTTIETAHNNQLIAIRNQIISQMETIPLAMIDDEAVIAEIRALVVEEVEAAFQRRE